MKTTATQGSFGMPKEMLDELDRIKKKKSEGVSTPKESISESDVEGMNFGAEVPEKKAASIPDEVPKELSRDQQIAEALKQIREDLGVVIDEDDLWSILYSNCLTKRNVTIIPGKMHATFRTHSLDETNAIDIKMAKVMEETRMENGIKNVNAQHILSYGLRELGKPGKMRSIGETPEARFKVLGEMSTMVIEVLVKKWNEFVFLVDQSVKEEMKGKKS